MSTTRPRTVAFAAIAAITGAVCSAPADSEVEAACQKLVKDQTSALVTVKFVLKVKMGGPFGSMGDQENEEEAGGVMIEPSGLVLVSNTQLGGFAGMMRRFMGSMAGEISAIPTDLKVLVGDDTEGVEAELLARDTELDLAWVKIKEPGDKRFAAADLSKSAKPRLGQKLLVLSRMGKYFDRTPLVRETRIAGFASKPRELYVLSGAGGLGLPVYTADGQLVGVTIVQMPEALDAAANPFAMLGQASELESSMGGLILPAEEVLKATKRAQETAAKGAAEEASPEESTGAEDSDKTPD
jgi:hypothetical protein